MILPFNVETSENLHLCMQCTVKIPSKQERHFYFFLCCFLPTTSRSHNKSNKPKKKETQE